MKRWRWMCSLRLAIEGAGAVNAELTRLYWSVGQRLATDVLGGERAQYGSQLMARLGLQLVQEFGRGFEAKNLRRMVQFAQAFPEPEKVAALMRQLSWTHFLQLIPVKTEDARWFYAQQCLQARWSVRELRLQIERKAYERSEIASVQGPALQTPDENAPALVFKDPYFLDFLGLRQGHDEADLEAAILRQLEAFVLELGRAFAFVERQKRMVIDGEDSYLDLLFFHRRLCRLVAIELKLGRFKAGHKGQMELYLAWLNQNERQTWRRAAHWSHPLRRSQPRTSGAVANAPGRHHRRRILDRAAAQRRIAAATAPSLARSPGALGAAWCAGRWREWGWVRWTDASTVQEKPRLRLYSLASRPI